MHSTSISYYDAFGEGAAIIPKSATRRHRRAQKPSMGWGKSLGNCYISYYTLLILLLLVLLNAIEYYTGASHFLFYNIILAFLTPKLKIGQDIELISRMRN